MTEKEVGEALSVSRSALRKLWREGRLVPLKLGRSIRYPAGDVRAFVEGLITEQRG
ncbi:MAG: Helix-turn-helix domain-containing protein [Chloroflexi bacterium]|nr:MAG: Helix-turn-helix domain-containing protein [Chloroflexota bacterium]